MAEAFLQVVCENLNSLIHKELGLLWGVGKEMEKLASTLSTIRAVLEDAEERQFKDKAIQIWLQKLKDTAYDVDNILDECATETLRLDFQAHNSRFINKIHASFLTCYHLEKVLFRHKIGKRMKEIGERLDEIAQERIRFHLREGVMERRVEAIERCETGSILTQSHVYGREEDGEKIVELLVKQVSNCEDVSIYPIIGMGGLGKTTLAQLVFNDERVNRHFETKIWACVSEDFDVKRVIKAILRSQYGDASGDSELEPLQRRLREMLNGKRYLLVLDDVWNEDQEKWDRLKYVLACGSKGSAIITTTRVEKVALIMGTLPPHRLSGLSEGDCWSLFRQRAFANEVEERPNLVAIGKEIVRKCGGVPLAAKALGGLMRFKREENEWLFVKESEIWNLPQDENSILPVLRLSYYNLPLELRQCFSYCAIFPKDSEIEKKNIIDLWMANGFISPKEGLELEDIGNEIWNELYWRSFFQDVKKDFWGNIYSFKMHDLVHDLAQLVQVDECSIMEAGKSTNTSKRIRHVRLVINSEKLLTSSERLVSIPEALSKAESLRTLLLQPMGKYKIQFSMSEMLYMPQFFSKYFKFGCLRVLVARDTTITKVSSSIGKLKHLRYLDLSFTNIRMLPESICNLWNLQTLKIGGCRYLQGLPKQMRQLRNLRHLYMYGCASITQMPPKIGQLTCLKVLSFFIVGKERGFHLRELHGLNLRGELDIKHLERVEDLKDAREANLVGKKDLRHLFLSWEGNGESEMQKKNAEQIFEGLEPHPNLELLDIERYMGTHFPLWMRNPVLKNVTSISLSNCKNCLELPPFGKLPSLRTLEIVGMNYVECIDNESYGGDMRGFPSLETIRIIDFPSLKRLTKKEGKELFPLLTKLNIEKCPKLSLPCLLSLKELKVRRCSEVLLGSISNLHSLTSLAIADDDELISFPNRMLRNLSILQTLQIRSFTKLEVLPTDLASLIALESFCLIDCHELECLPEQGLRGLISLQDLAIHNCNKLKSLSEGLQFLTALVKLAVRGCPELVGLPEGSKHLNSLQHLIMSGGSFGNETICPKLVVLPEVLQRITALQSLYIDDYPHLESLPDGLGNLTSLQSLHISYCPKLTSLPESIQSLTQLRTLWIRGCPELQRQCEKERGEDWYKISHIPQVFMNTKSESKVNVLA